MAKITNVPWFRREDYEMIRKLVTDLPEFALSFEQWEHRAQQRVAQCEARGDIAVKVIIDPKEFSTWCQANGMDYNFATLGAFTVAMARKQAERGRLI